VGGVGRIYTWSTGGRLAQGLAVCHAFVDFEEHLVDFVLGLALRKCVELSGWGLRLAGLLFGAAACEYVLQCFQFWLF
jgi:hypothetical protein